MVESMVETVLLAALVLLVILHLVAPLALRRAFRFAGKFQAHLLPVQEMQPDLEQRLAEVGPSLKSLGFEYLGCYDFGELSAHTRTRIAVFNHPDNQDLVSFTVSSASGFTDTYLEFSTEFGNGQRLETNNNGVLPLTPDPKGARIFRFSEVREPRDLYHLHHQLIEKYASGAWAKPGVKGQEILRWVRNMENYGPRHAEIGYMKLVRNSGEYELTWKGAALMAWKAMCPTVIVRRLLHRSAMNAELRSLEVRGVTSLQKA